MFLNGDRIHSDVSQTPRWNTALSVAKTARRGGGSFNQVWARAAGGPAPNSLSDARFTPSRRLTVLVGPRPHWTCRPCRRDSQGSQNAGRRRELLIGVGRLSRGSPARALAEVARVASAEPMPSSCSTSTSASTWRQLLCATRRRRRPTGFVEYLRDARHLIVRGAALRGRRDPAP